MAASDRQRIRPCTRATDPIDEAVVRDTVSAGAAALGITLADGDVDALAIHYRELMRWRKRADLSSIVDPRQVAVRHYLDSLALSPWLPLGARIADLGSGAGFPGIPIAIARRDVAVTLLETREVKLAFLHHVCARLDRPNLAVARTGAFVTTGGCERLDIVVARAVASVPETLERCELLLQHGGELWLMRGPSRIGEDEDTARRGWKVVSEREVRLPVEDAKRRIVVWRLTSSRATG